MPQLDKQRDNKAGVVEVVDLALVFSPRRIRMNVLQQVFGGKYNDEKLVSIVEQAIAVDPLLQDTTAIIVASKKGVIKLTGKMHSDREKERTESVIRTTLNTANLKFDKIVNYITVA